MPGTDRHRRVNVNTQQIELKGQSFEVMTQAVVRSTMKVGDRLRILKKATYVDHAVFDGIVIGFEPFKTMPSIVIAYIEDGYNVDVKFLVWNDSTKDIEITAALVGPFEKNIDFYAKKIGTKIDKLQQEIRELELKLEYMKAKFGMTTGQIVEEAIPEPELA